jgi:ABC-2 type transport system ATP-binding protein
VEPLGENRLRLKYSGENPAAAVAEQAVTRGWGLLELVPERRTLEQIFIELTCQDVPATSATGEAA